MAQPRVELVPSARLGKSLAQSIVHPDKKMKIKELGSNIMNKQI